MRALTLLCLAGVLALGACKDEAAPAMQSDSAETIAAGEPIEATSTLGPVSATVSLRPNPPRIGDVMGLDLVVEAEAGVDVEMPVFQEALSRFAVEGYVDDAAPMPGGGTRFEQRYRLHASSSGRLRIPPMRVVFVDGREDSEAQGEEQELLTDELSVKIESVLAGENPDQQELRPIRRSLEEDLGPGHLAQYWWAYAAGVAGAALLGSLFFLRRGRREEIISPYERASVALSRLEARGMPEAEELDNWYVELSSIVRRYLEDRFGLRAPELTTEEFLRVAQRSVLLSGEHKSLLTGFLTHCDQVKFAGYEPESDESRKVLESARRFLLETRDDALDEGGTENAKQKEAA